MQCTRIPPLQYLCTQFHPTPLHPPLMNLMDLHMSHVFHAGGLCGGGGGGGGTPWRSPSRSAGSIRVRACRPTTNATVPPDHSPPSRYCGTPCTPIVTPSTMEFEAAWPLLAHSAITNKSPPPLHHDRAVPSMPAKHSCIFGFDGASPYMSRHPGIDCGTEYQATQHPLHTR